MKKLLCVLFSLLMALSFVSCSNGDNIDPNKHQIDLSAYKYPTPQKSVDMIDTKNVNVSYIASSNGYFYQNKNGKSADLLYIKGVNMGLTEAQTSLDNSNISYDTFMNWFEEIKDMNANTVRVFSIMNPNFYKALYDFNKKNSSSPLYLIQGIWFSEDLMYQLTDALESDEIIISAFKKACKETVDIIHGNSSDTVYGEFSPAIYDKDVSKYTVGYILGLEYPADFVIETNASHPDKANYNGKYLETKSGSTPFEAFLANVGDYLVDCETSAYNSQTPVAFLNWQVLDTITHTNEPYKEENDAVSVNTENITAKSNYYPGLFAAVDVYPYYPEFMNYEEKYTSYTDEKGEKDNYRAYLNDLKTQYSVPLLIAEYGLSTSRGKAHLGLNGYDQGGLNEDEQAKLVSKMTNDIALEGCAGGLVFEWADEWFKSTWNINMYYPDDPTKRTQNLSSAEQSYGILWYDTSTSYPDGDLSEWKNAYKVNDNLKVMYDANYMHLLLTLPDGFDTSKDTFFVPISTNGTGSKFSKKYNLKFSDNTDFLLVFNGKDNTRILCDKAQDVFHYKFGVIRKVFGTSQSKAYKQNTGEYDKINTFVSNEIIVPSTNERIEPRYYEGGLLKFGNANPDSSDYDSSADFYYNGNTVEIRIAWYLLNVMNPTTKACINTPFKGDEITYSNFDAIKIGSGTEGKIKLNDAKFTGVKNVKLTQRLKKVYYSLQDLYPQINL
ncbi:MAG: hypothetical protein PUF01_04700 [Eubacteriales bacterium]|nr:hypothetical protein [Eubacteriales bacterium]